MTKEEQNQIIKDAWVRNLRKTTDIPSNIGDIYKHWVLNKIEQATAQLVQQQGASQAQGQEQGQEQAQGQQEAS